MEYERVISITRYYCLNSTPLNFNQVEIIDTEPMQA